MHYIPSRKISYARTLSNTNYQTLREIIVQYSRVHYVYMFSYFSFIIAYNSHNESRHQTLKIITLITTHINTKLFIGLTVHN